MTSEQTEKKQTATERVADFTGFVVYLFPGVAVIIVALWLVALAAVHVTSVASCKIDPTTERCTVLHERGSSW